MVLPLIKADLQLSDAQLGLIASMLVWTYGLLVPIAGFAGDVWSRKKIIIYCLLFWSLSTLSTGLCTTLLQFLLIRGMATGGGEAFYAPSANALISQFHSSTRAFALSLHQTAVYVGIISSGLLAGYVGAQYGWRMAFFMFGGFGIVLAGIMFWRLKDKLPSFTGNMPLATEKVPVKEAVLLMFRKPTAILLTLAFAGMVFVNVGYLTWMPTFLGEKFQLSLADAGFSSMFYHHMAAFIGVLAGGKLSDVLARKRPRARLEIQSLSFLLAAPFIYVMGTADSKVTVYVALAGFGFFRGIYDSNIFASLYEVIPLKFRSSASGIMLMFAFLTGASSPYILGSLKPTLGLSVGLSSLAVCYVFSSVMIALAFLFFYKQDQHKEIELEMVTN